MYVQLYLLLNLFFFITLSTSAQKSIKLLNKGKYDKAAQLSLQELQTLKIRDAGTDPTLLQPHEIIKRITPYHVLGLVSRVKGDFTTAELNFKKADSVYSLFDEALKKTLADKAWKITVRYGVGVEFMQKKQDKRFYLRQLEQARILMKLGELESAKAILNKLETPILVTRVSDIENTDTFSSTKNLHIDMVWKANGAAQGFSQVDLDMFLHDTNNTNIQNFDELDFGSVNSDSYEKIQVDASSTLFKAGVPERLGFYFFEKYATTTSVTVEYMYKIYSYDGRTKRFTVYGSFTSPPMINDDGSFYLGAAITKTNTTYKVEKLTPVVKWQP